MGRWKALLSPAEIAQLESAIGDLLVEVGYPLSTPRGQAAPTWAMRMMSLLYPAVFDLKLWLKTSTPWRARPTRGAWESPSRRARRFYPQKTPVVALSTAPMSAPSPCHRSPAPCRGGFLAGGCITLIGAQPVVPLPSTLGGKAVTWLIWTSFSCGVADMTMAKDPKPLYASPPMSSTTRSWT